MEIVIQKPDGTVEYKSVRVAKSFKAYEYPLVFGYATSQVGKYEISLKFDGELFKKMVVNISKEPPFKQIEEQKQLAISKAIETAKNLEQEQEERILEEEIQRQLDLEKQQIVENKQETLVEKQVKESEGGGCLIATATYGSELAPQVQQLRELRDNKLLNTESGISFINSFNDFYYSFSPIIADYERENPVFKEMVKIVITPMITSLSILNYVDMDSEAEVLGYGISLILLNVGMYFVAPVIIIVGIKKKLP